MQLLVERAQYITGATGAALALPSGEEMVCRASAGTSAPPVGARLQVRSGLTGESIARRQLLRCDNAENDARVNLETCRQMGIASIVVMPLLRASGEIRGLFELFSDHAYAFEERDLSALERMADLTLTALDLAEGPPGPAAGATRASIAARGTKTPEPRVETAEAVAAPAGVGDDGAETAEEEPKIDPKPDRESEEEAVVVKVEAPPVGGCAPSESVVAGLLEDPPGPVQAAPVPEAMRRVRKCVACGFPVSEGRTYCLDCERRESKPSASAERVGLGSMPSFRDMSESPKESWLANHVNLLAIVVLVLGVLVVIVVFR